MNAHILYTLQAKTARHNERLAMLIEKEQEFDEHKAELIELINFIYKSVFVHRYRYASNWS